MSTKKMTKRDYYAMLKELVADREDLTAFIDHEVELLDRKNAKAKNGEKKMTASQVANVKLANEIYDAMVENHSYTISEMIKTFDLKDSEGTPLSTSKVSAVVRVNMLDSLVSRTEIKGRAYFTKIVNDIEGE